MQIIPHGHPGVKAAGPIGVRTQPPPGEEDAWRIFADINRLDARSGFLGLGAEGRPNGAQHLWLLLILEGFARAKAWCWPSNAILAAKTGKGERAVQAILNDLQAAGVLTPVYDDPARRHRAGFLLHRRLGSNLPVVAPEEIASASDALRADPARHPRTVSIPIVSAGKFAPGAQISAVRGAQISAPEVVVSVPRMRTKNHTAGPGRLIPGTLTRQASHGPNGECENTRRGAMPEAMQPGAGSSPPAGASEGRRSDSEGPHTTTTAGAPTPPPARREPEPTRPEGPTTAMPPGGFIAALASRLAIGDRPPASVVAPRPEPARSPRPSPAPDPAPTVEAEVREPESVPSWRQLAAEAARARDGSPAPRPGAEGPPSPGPIAASPIDAALTASQRIALGRLTPEQRSRFEALKPKDRAHLLRGWEFTADDPAAWREAMILNGPSSIAPIPTPEDAWEDLVAALERGDPEAESALAEKCARSFDDRKSRPYFALVTGHIRAGHLGTDDLLDAFRAAGKPGVRNRAAMFTRVITERLEKHRAEAKLGLAAVG